MPLTDRGPVFFLSMRELLLKIIHALVPHRRRGDGKACPHDWHQRWYGWPEEPTE